MTHSDAGAAAAMTDAARITAIQFAADDVVVLLCERVATAYVFARLFSEALAATEQVPGRVPNPQVNQLLQLLHRRRSDAELEAMELHHAALELADRERALQASSRLPGGAGP